MTGYVDENDQPKIDLLVRGQKQQKAIEAVVDTGFNGELCIPISIAVQLGLELTDYRFVELADGAVHRDLIFAGTVILDKNDIVAEISLTNSEEALLGTGLLKDQKLEIGFVSRSLTIQSEAAQILIDSNKPVEAVSRAYYAAYQMVTGTLVKLNLNPRTEQGNWAHQETIKMYRIHICHKTGLGSKEKNALMNLLPKFRHLLERRIEADYGVPTITDMPLIKSHWRDANRLVSLVKSLIKRGLL